MAPRVIVVGGGCEKPHAPLQDRELTKAVSGLSAAHTIYLAGGNVLLLDKNSQSLPSILVCFQY